MSYSGAPMSKRIRWFITDAAELCGYVLVAILIALSCAAVIGLAVRLSFWAAGVG